MIGIDFVGWLGIDLGGLGSIWGGLGSILVAQMAPKSRSEGGPDTLSHGYQSQIKKNKVLAGFMLLALSTLRRCNLTVKTHVFLKISVSSL